MLPASQRPQALLKVSRALHHQSLLRPERLLLLVLLLARLGPWQPRLVQAACQTARFQLQAWQTDRQLAPAWQGRLQLLPLLLLLLLLLLL
jgi:hypothetical protein